MHRVDVCLRKERSSYVATLTDFRNCLMVSLRRRLPPLTALTAFESAARLLSFTEAAKELGVTPAAVSRQIHLLEEELGFLLFVRLHRRIELTAKGKTLSLAAGNALNLIASTVAELTSNHSENQLTIAATVAFSHFWLLPRISEFSRQHPEISLRIVTQDDTPNIETGDLDIAIRFGTGVWPDGQAILLFDDEIFPICTPEYACNAGSISSPSDLVEHPLISNDADDQTWTGWTEWLAAFSVALPKKTSGFRCSYYTDAVYAALNGQGIALGWKRLVEDLLRQHRLVRLTEAMIKTRSAYFVVLPTRRTQKEASKQFLEWLKMASL